MCSAPAGAGLFAVVDDAALASTSTLLGCHGPGCAARSSAATSVSGRTRPPLGAEVDVEQRVAVGHPEPSGADAGRRAAAPRRRCRAVVGPSSTYVDARPKPIAVADVIADLVAAGARRAAPPRSRRAAASSPSLWSMNGRRPPAQRLRQRAAGERARAGCRGRRRARRPGSITRRR